MKKYWLIVPLLLLAFGCQKNIVVDENINNFVKDNSYDVVSNRVDSLITNLLIVSNQKSEDEFIYYVKAILLNEERFTSEEMNTIYRKLNMGYRFEFNSFGYTNDDYEDDLKEIFNIANNKKE